MGYAITVPQIIHVLRRCFAGQVAHERCAEAASAIMDEIVRLDACYGKAGLSDSDEPVFVLRSQDVVAPDAVEDWLGRMIDAGLYADSEKVLLTREHVDRMRAWQAMHGSKVPD